jgi:ABC-type amino acid transport substrate-binding protein
MKHVLAAFALFIVQACCFAQANADAWNFVHNGPEAADDHRYDYHWTVLKAALESTRARYGDYTLKDGEFMTEARQITEMKASSGRINTMVLDSTAELERDFLPVKVPVDKGLLGYRVFLIHSKNQTRFSQVTSLDDLRKFSMGQGADWSDVAIFKAAGFQVVAGSSYAGLFDMLMRDRFDAFGRGVTEINPEYEVHVKRLPGLTIEQTVLLYYPMPVYFWFPRSPKGEQLAQRVREGMQTISSNGTLDRLFKKEFDPLIKSLRLKNRLLLRIPNPLLPADQPFDNRRYWFDPLK